MQLRFDGMLGFPGGYVNRCENITKGLNRELEEEIALDKRYCVPVIGFLYQHVLVVVKRLNLSIGLIKKL